MFQYQVLGQGIWTKIFGKPPQQDIESSRVETKTTRWFDVRTFLLFILRRVQFGTFKVIFFPSGNKKALPVLLLTFILKL